MDEILKFLIWLCDEKEIVLCKEVRANPFFDKYVPLSCEDLSTEYRRDSYFRQIQQWADAYDREKPPMTPEEFKVLLDSIQP